MDPILFEVPEGSSLLQGYPVQCYRNSYTYGMCAPLHWHFFSEIIYVNRGSQEVTVGNRIEHLRSGGLIYINPRQAHLAYSGDQQETCLTVLKFDPSLICPPLHSEAEEQLISPFLNYDLTQSLVFPMNTLPDPVPGLLDEILEVTGARKFGCEYRTRSLLCELIWLLASALRESGGMIVDRSPLAEQELERFRTAIHYINSHYSQPIPLKSLTEICSLSYSNFAVKFKQLTGKTPVEYINHVRISQAQQMLLLSSIPVGEIAEACGFNDVAYFNRVFRRISGRPPHAFRKNALSAET